jgi:hypothetical protein
MPETQNSVLKNVLTSESFVEKVALLIITALLTGLLLPYALARYNNGVAARLKAADLARTKNDSIVQAQSKLVEDLASVVFTYETLALDVSWYKTGAGKDEKLYQKAYEKYSDKIVDLLSTWRSLSARSQTLTSPAVSARINDFQVRVFTQQDTPMIALNRRNASEKEWEDQHYRNEQMLTEAHLLISQIMEDVGLSKNDLHEETTTQLDDSRRERIREHRKT